MEQSKTINKNALYLFSNRNGYNICIDTRSVHSMDGAYHVETLLINKNAIIDSVTVHEAIENDDYKTSRKDNLICLDLRNSDTEDGSWKWDKPGIKDFVNKCILSSFSLKLKGGPETDLTFEEGGVWGRKVDWI